MMLVAVAVEILHASNFASKLIGMDLSIESLSFAKEFVQSDNLILKKGDNLDIPIDSDSIDIVSDGVCHHTGNTISVY